MDNSQLLEQMSTIQSMQTTTDLTTALQLNQASGLIGMSITGLNTDGQEVTGQVESVSLDDDSPSLIVNGTKVPLDGVTRIVQDTDQALDQALMLDSIVATNQLSAAMELGQASALIGKTVTGTDSTGQEVTGIVERATVAGDSVSLVIGESTVSLSNVTEVLST